LDSATLQQNIRTNKAATQQQNIRTNKAATQQQNIRTNKAATQQTSPKQPKQQQTTNHVSVYLFVMHKRFVPQDPAVHQNFC
jgi:hypothetical protein